MNKTLNVTNSKDLGSKISDVETYGDPDSWVLICKASSKSQGWMKSTKAMDLGGACLVQVTTQQGDNVAESVTYVPDIEIVPASENEAPKLGVISEHRVDTSHIVNNAKMNQITIGKQSSRANVTEEPKPPETEEEPRETRQREILD